jgi:uncharacterized protein Yka (UPF0111/DUF47 family)
MSTLQQLLGKEDKFFDLFEASAVECRNSVAGLVSITEKSTAGQDLDPITQARRKDKSIHNQLSEELCSTVVTSMERDDILSLAHSLYKIPKTVEKVGERVLLRPAFMEGFSITEQLDMLKQCTDTLLNMVQALRRNAHVQEIRSLNDRLQTLEGEADKLVMERLRELYSGEMEGRRLVYLKDIFELLEQATDRCRDAGNVIVRIALKNT